LMGAGLDRVVRDCVEEEDFLVYMRWVGCS